MRRVGCFPKLHWRSKFSIKLLTERASHRVSRSEATQACRAGSNLKVLTMKVRVSRAPKKLLVIGVRVDDEWLRKLNRWISENEPQFRGPKAFDD
jgi:hypothetical protein